MTSSDTKTPPLRLSLWIWCWGALFYLLGFFHRVAPAVITTELMQEFDLNGIELGNLSAFYFYSYVAMQIPTGILTDRLGPRRLLTLGALVATVGAATFGLATGYFQAAFGRFLIGGSVAVAFVSLLKISANWFSPSRFALLSGLALFSGIIGAVSGGTPLRLIVDLLGWRHSIFITAVITIFIGIGVWVFVRDFPVEKGYKNFTQVPPDTVQNNQGIVSDLLNVCKYRNTILLFLIPGAIVGCILTFSGLWGVPYLVTVYDLSPTSASAITSMMLVAWALGGPFFGWMSDRVGNRKSLYLLGTFLTTVGWTTVVFWVDLPLRLLSVLLVIVGFSSGCMIINFAFAKESVPIRLAGTVSGVVNMGVMMGPMILQPLVGLILDKHWDGALYNGVRVYSTSAYRNGFSVFLVWLAISLLLLIITRETRCRQRMD